MYRLKKERDELRYKVTELLIEILKHINTSSEPSPKDKRRITERLITFKTYNNEYNRTRSSY